MDPVIFNIGNFEIRWYSVILLCAFLVGVFFINRESKRFEVPKDFTFNLVFWTLIFGILGARIYYVIFDWGYYSSHINEIWKIWNGGLAIYGGIIGAIIYTWLFCRRKKIVFFNFADLGAPYLALSQSIGRWGNFVNQEAYGYETNVPWKMGIFDSAISDYIYVHPTFFYESICNFILFFILMKLSKNRKFGGQVFFAYMISYGLIRSVIEGLRTDSLMMGNFRVSQVLSVIFVVMFGILYYRAEKCRTKDTK